MKSWPQMLIFVSVGLDMMACQKTGRHLLINFPFLTLWTLCTGSWGSNYMHELPYRVGEESGPLEILENCLFPTPQRLLWHPLHILGGGKLYFALVITRWTLVKILFNLIITIFYRCNATPIIKRKTHATWTCNYFLLNSFSSALFVSAVVQLIDYNWTSVIKVLWLETHKCILNFTELINEHVILKTQYVTPAVFKSAIVLNVSCVWR